VSGAEALSAERVVAFLLAEDLLEEADFLTGDVRLEEAAGRNHCFRVVSTGERSYFFKQAQPGEAGGARGIRNEAEFYGRVEADDRLASLRPFLPRLHRYEPGRGFLVLELRPAYQTIYEAGEADPDLGLPPISQFLAVALAACHLVQVAGGNGDSPLSALPRLPPWALDIPRPPPEILQDLSPGQVQILKLLQERPRIAAQLDGLRSAWAAGALVHGDLKWANLLVEVESPGGRPIGLKLIDWELARLGDPAWDIGSVFQSYLSHSVLALPLPEDATPEIAAQAFAACLPAVHRHIGIFWTAYIQAVRLSPGGAQSLLDRSTGYCAARLLQSAFEWTQYESRMPRSAAAILQLSLNIFANPRAAQGGVLGLPSGGGPG